MAKVTINGVRGTIGPSNRKNKKWKFTPDNKNKNPVHAGQKGAKIRPGTEAGDSFCSRSASNGGGQKGKVTPNDLARFKWKCRGKKSMKK